MFYKQLIALCQRDGVKPTPLIKSLGFSAGNIKRWENGATVNSDILLAVAERFKVSIDYLLTGEEQPAQGLSEDEAALINDFRSITEEGQAYIQHQMFIAKEIYKQTSEPAPNEEP